MDSIQVLSQDRTTEMILNTADVTDITGSPRITNVIKWTVPNDAGWKIHVSL